MTLSGEIAIVTGGSRNIGLAIAAGLRGAGARLCIVGRSDRDALETARSELQRLQPASDASVMAELVDVSDEAAVVDLFDQVEKSWGPPSILVNGAAIRPHVPFVDLSRDAWSEVLDTILTGAFLTSRELFRRLPKDRNGAIVNIGGLSAHRPARDRAHVIAAKSGLVGLTRALAEEGRGRIRANTVVPGLIETARRPGQSGPHFSDAEHEGPRGTSDDVARIVLAFCHPNDVYVTGQTVHVSGGRVMP